MALLTILFTAGVLLCTSLGYLVRTVYTHRRKINELRKRGVVSFPPFFPLPLRHFISRIIILNTSVPT